VIYCILGNGRITALKEDGHEFVDVELKYVTADEAFQMSLDENDEREDLNPLDRALQFKNWIESTGISQTRIAELRNKTQPWVSANLRLLNLPLEIQTHIRNGAISMNQANKILRLKNDSDQLYIANLCIEKQSEKYIDEQVSLRLSEMDEALKALEPEEPNTETKPITIVIPNTEAGILKPEPSYSLPVSPSSKGYDHMSKTDLEIELDRQQREKEALKKPYHAWKYLDERQDQHCKEMDTCANCFNKEPAKWKVCKTKNKLSKETFAPNVKADFLDE
jgi:ParB-like chromosome segregation protein Spo0J